MGSDRKAVDLFEYICLRIKQLGIRSIHGVPGDFNLASLDYIQRCGLQWVGNCNELNAGYAADGYARVNGISALMTVMGVGELSALNAMAGSFAEYVPVIHIISMPSRRAQQNRLCLHHTLGDGDYEVFKAMSSAVSCMAVTLSCSRTAPAQIDKAIQACQIQSRPVCLFVPSDLVRSPVPADLLEIRLNSAMPLNDLAENVNLVDAILGEFKVARNPVLLIGCSGVLPCMRDDILGVLEALSIPVLTTASGKGLIDESHPLYSGLYVGSCSDQSTMEHMKAVDLIVSIGLIQSDLSTAGFSGTVDPLKTVDLQRDRAYVKGVLYSGIGIQTVLKMLIVRAGTIFPSVTQYNDIGKDLAERRLRSHLMRGKTGLWMSKVLAPLCRLGIFCNQQPIHHDWFWPALGPWLRQGDVVLAEAGTASFGIWTTSFPSGIIFISQYLWASIGYTVGACQGAALAVRDSSSPYRRTILFIGDGSLQVGCQELSTIIRQGLTPIIFVICNNGYTIERLIHGPNEQYNDIQPWNYGKLPAVFGANAGQYCSHRVRTRQQLRHLLGQRRFSDCPVLQLVELCIPQNDAPLSLSMVAETLRMRNEQEGLA